MTEMIFDLLQKPFIQTLFFIILTILAIVIIGPRNADHAWTIAGVIFIGFVIVNSILISLVPNSWSYFFYSMGFSALYFLGISIIMPVIIKIMKLDDPAESAMIFIVIIYHPVFLLFVLSLKWAYFKIF